MTDPTMRASDDAKIEVFTDTRNRWRGYLDEWERAQAALVRVLASSIEALIEQGVDVTPQQYHRALVKAARQEVEAAPRSMYRAALAQAIADHLAWRRVFYGEPGCK
jgi:hypothetical protein